MVITIIDTMYNIYTGKTTLVADVSFSNHRFDARYTFETDVSVIDTRPKMMTFVEAEIAKGKASHFPDWTGESWTTSNRVDEALSSAGLQAVL